MSLFSWMSLTTVNDTHLLRGVPRFEAVRFFAVDVRADRLSVADFVRLQFGHFCASILGSGKTRRASVR